MKTLQTRTTCHLYHVQQLQDLCHVFCELVCHYDFLVCSPWWGCWLVSFSFSSMSIRGALTKRFKKTWFGIVFKAWQPTDQKKMFYCVSNQVNTFFLKYLKSLRCKLCIGHFACFQGETNQLWYFFQKDSTSGDKIMEILKPFWLFEVCSRPQERQWLHRQGTWKDLFSCKFHWPFPILCSHNSPQRQQKIMIKRSPAANSMDRSQFECQQKDWLIVDSCSFK